MGLKEEWEDFKRKIIPKYIFRCETCDTYFRHHHRQPHHCMACGARSVWDTRLILIAEPDINIVQELIKSQIERREAEG